MNWFEALLNDLTWPGAVVCVAVCFLIAWIVWVMKSYE